MALIKHADLTDLSTVLPLNLDTRKVTNGPLEPFLEPAAPPARQPSESEKQLAELRKAVRLLEDRLSDEIPKAREQGRKDAEAAYARDDAALVALLTANLDAASAKAARSFEDMEKLALLICENALSKVFAKPQSYRSLITDAISKQLGQIRKETVVGVWVSREDFPDQAALQALSSGSAGAAVHVRHDPELPSGDCRIDLRLGHVELSIRDHWAALKACLADLASEAISVQR